jgi:hypothetical protein
VLLTHYVTLYFPEIERFWAPQRNGWFIRLLIRFPTPASISALSVEEFRARIWKSMGRRVHKEAKIQQIHCSSLNLDRFIRSSSSKHRKTARDGVTLVQIGLN